jgi:hypothetical protein
LLPLAAVPLLKFRGGENARRMLAACDEVLLKLPWFRWQAWTSIWTFSGPKRTAPRSVASVSHPAEQPAR